MPEDQGTIAHILKILSYLDRPRNALAVGTENLLDDNPDTGFWQGAYSGLMGDRERSWADLAGIDRPQSSDEWLPWLGKGALHLGGDALLDPLILLGPAAKLGKAGKLGAPTAKALEYLATPYRAASEYVHGSSLGRAFAHDVPAHLREDFSVPYQAALREKEEALAPIVQMYREGKPLEASIADVGAARQAWERNIPGGVPEEVLPYWRSLWEQSGRSRDELNALAEQMTGKPLVGEVAENPLLTWTPRAATDQARRYLQQSDLTRGGGRSIGPETFESRELQLLVDPEAWARGELQHVGQGGKPLVTKLDHPLSGVEQTDRGFTLKQGDQAIPVTPQQATLQEIYQSGVVPKGTWVQGVSESYMADILRKEGQKAYLKWMSGGMDKWLKPVANLSEIPKNWRMLKVEGFKNYAAPKWAANEIEKRSRRLFDPETPMGMLEQLGDAALNTKLGGLFREGTQWWKRNVLVHPGYFIGNATSDIPLMYSAGVDAWMLPVRKAQAVAVQTGRGAKIFGNLSNVQLGEEFARRGLWSTTWGGSEASDILRQVTKEGFLRRNLADLPGVKGTIGRGVTKVGESWGKLNDALLSKFGGNIEANSRIGVAIDWLKRNDIKAPTPEDFDRAAMFANQKMIDYGSLTPFEKQLAMIVPFISFQRGMMGRFAEDLVSSPERLARLGRFLDQTLEPMPSDEKRISDAWIQENAPTFGAFGTSWDDIYKKLGGAEPEEAGPRMGLAGRFLPWTQLEALTSRPSDAILSSINPLIKSPAELVANYSTFKDQPIDSLEGFPQNLNPYTAQMATESPFGLRLPASWNYLLTQMPGGRTLKAVSELGRGAGLWTDPYKAETSPGESLSWYATGGKFYPFDRNKQLTRRQWEADRKAREIEKKAEFAWARDDYAGVEHYAQLLQEHQAKVERMLGFVE